MFCSMQNSIMGAQRYQEDYSMLSQEEHYSSLRLRTLRLADSLLKLWHRKSFATFTYILLNL